MVSLRHKLLCLQICSWTRSGMKPSICMVKCVTRQRACYCSVVLYCLLYLSANQKLPMMRNEKAILIGLRGFTVASSQPKCTLLLYLKGNFNRTVLKRFFFLDLVENFCHPSLYMFLLSWPNGICHSLLLSFSPLVQRSIYSILMHLWHSVTVNI